MCTMEDRADQWRTKLIASDIWQLFQTCLSREVRHTWLVTDHQHLHVPTELLPGLDRITLDQGNVRVRKGFGGGENRDEWGGCWHGRWCYWLRLRWSTSKADLCFTSALMEVNSGSFSNRAKTSCQPKRPSPS